MSTDNKIALMYTNDSEAGRVKLQSVKENLYESTTKVVLYSIEMYTKKSLSEWASTDLVKNLDKIRQGNGKALIAKKEDLEQGLIGSLDITNGCAVINEFVREDALKKSREVRDKKITQQESKLEELEKELNLLQERKSELETELLHKTDSETKSDGEAVPEDNHSEDDIFFGEDSGKDYSDSENSDEWSENIADEEETENNDSVYDDEDEAVIQPSEYELFRAKVSGCRDISEIDNLIEGKTEEKTAVKALKEELRKLTRDGGDGQKVQDVEENEKLENLRKMRNVFAHCNEDDEAISKIGSWSPEGGHLYVWANLILDYIRTIEKRYILYSSFDEYYAVKEGKDKFDACKVYVQRQIKELYVNRSNIVLEFAGDLYDKEDDEYNFGKLIENMAISWNTGIRYLTVVTNDDIPELNVFFKECLSGTKKYVDSYIVDRNALRDKYRKKDSEEVDYVYFRLLYHLNPAMEKIYWKGLSYTRKEFASKVIYKFIKVKSRFQFEARLKEYEKYLDGINIKKWCEYHMLSKIYFSGHDDAEGVKLAEDMEESLLEFCNSKGKEVYQKFRKAVKASVRLYFYMGDEYLFSYTRENGKTVHWKSLEDACGYIENADKFKNYSELTEFIEELYRSDYFKIWKNVMIKQKQESVEPEI